MKKKFVINRDRIFSIGMAIFSVIIMILTSRIKPTFGSISGSDPGSKTFPYMVSVLLLLSSIGKFITCNKPDETSYVEGKKGLFKLLIVILTLLVYVYVMKYIGFLICTFAGTAILLFIMKGQQKVKTLTYILYPAILTAILYLLFDYILKVRLPVGSLWAAIL